MVRVFLFWDQHYGSSIDAIWKGIVLKEIVDDIKETLTRGAPSAFEEVARETVWTKRLIVWNK